MNVIPKINGRVEKGEGVCPVSLPLTYRGDCAFACQFSMERAEKGVLAFETDASLPAEGYRLTIEPGRIVLASWDENGAYYGTQTLFQLIREGKGSLACGVYEDAPKYRYRGFLLDVSRHFFPAEEVKKLIDHCARLKLNVFHWHLSDDQGFRIESKKFPRLNEVGSWRTGKDGVRYGGYYTQEEIKEVVAYAEERYMTVIPEIDLPGHTIAVTAAYPELSCSGEPAQVETRWGVFPHILCAGNEKVYEFLHQLLDEVCGLFPEDGYFHIGGDEAPKEEWEKCPRCQEAIRREGLAGEEALQAWFTSRLVEFLNSRGKTVIGWNEILASGALGPNAVAQYWTHQGAESSAREISKGRKFIFSNIDSFYFDYDPSLVTLKGAYCFRPNIPGGEAIPPEQVLGLEAPLWTERIETPQRLEYMAFPRLAAVAENAWAADGDWEDFLRRAEAYESVWREEGVNAQPVKEAAAFDPDASARALIRQFRAWEPERSEAEVRNYLAEAPAARIARIMSPTHTAEEIEQVRASLKRLA